MKKKFLLLVGLLILSASISQLMAAPQASSTSSTPATDSTAHKAPPTPDEVVAMMDSKLSLTADQKAKITPIIADRQSQMKALGADTSMNRMDKARKMKSIFDDSDAKINALLTDEQKPKYAAMQQQMREQMMQRRQQMQQQNTSNQ